MYFLPAFFFLLPTTLLFPLQLHSVHISPVNIISSFPNAHAGENNPKLWLYSYRISFAKLGKLKRIFNLLLYHL